MIQSTTYEIQFSGLSLGNHVFDWNLEKSFFHSFNAEEILDAKVHAKVSLEKKERLMELVFTIDGEVKTICDRCGEDVWTTIQTEQELLVRFSNETDLSGDEVIFLDSGEYKLDVAQYLFEFSYLSLPVKRVHPDGECNEEVVDFLSESFENDSTQENAEDSNIDPRWEALKKLK